MARGANAPLPKPPSFDESKISDKPDWVATRPRARPHPAPQPEARPGAAPTLDPVDRRPRRRRARRPAERQGELDNTAIFFTSDNGYLFGEHRIFLNKVYPYEEALRVPLLARVPPACSARARGASGRPPTVDDAGQQPRPDRDHPRPRRRRALHRRRRLPHARRPLAAARCSAASGPTGRAGRALLYQLGSNRACGQLPQNGPEQLLRRDAHQALRLRRAQPRQQGDRRLRPARVRALRPKQDPYELETIAVNPRRRAPSALQAQLAAAARRRFASAHGIAGRDPADAGLLRLNAAPRPRTERVTV